MSMVERFSRVRFKFMTLQNWQRPMIDIHFYTQNYLPKLADAILPACRQKCLKMFLPPTLPTIKAGGLSCPDHALDDVGDENTYRRLVDIDIM